MVDYEICEEFPQYAGDGFWYVNQESIEEGDALTIDGAVELFRRYLKGISGTVRRIYVPERKYGNEPKVVKVYGDVWCANAKRHREAVIYSLYMWEEG